MWMLIQSPDCDFFLLQKMGKLTLKKLWIILRSLIMEGKKVNLIHLFCCSLDPFVESLFDINYVSIVVKGCGE